MKQVLSPFLRLEMEVAHQCRVKNDGHIQLVTAKLYI